MHCRRHFNKVIPMLATAAAMSALSAAMVRAQQPPAASAQCRANQDQVTVCANALDQCYQDFSAVGRQRNGARQEIDRLKGIACMPAPEPRWREIVEGALKIRLAGLLRAPSATNCEEFKFSVSSNGKVEFEGRMRDRTPVQTAKADLLRALPGIEIDDQKVRALTTDCGITLPDYPDHSIESANAMDRDNLGEKRIRRMPPASECKAKIGPAIDKHPSPELRGKLQAGVWVIDNGRTALCRKSPDSANGEWEVKATNLETGIVIQRETE